MVPPPGNVATNVPSLSTKCLGLRGSVFLVWWVENWQKCNMEVAKSFQKWRLFRLLNFTLRYLGCELNGWMPNVWSPKNFLAPSPFIMKRWGSAQGVRKAVRLLRCSSRLWPQGPADAIHRMSLRTCRVIWSVFKAYRLNWNNNWVCLGAELTSDFCFCFCGRVDSEVGNFWCILLLSFQLRKRLTSSCRSLSWGRTVENSWWSGKSLVRWAKLMRHRLQSMMCQIPMSCFRFNKWSKRRPRVLQRFHFMMVTSTSPCCPLNLATYISPNPSIFKLIPMPFCSQMS